MFFNIYISNKIGQEALGIFQLIMSVYLFAITFACSGINIAVTKIIAEELAIGNKTSIKKITSKCICISFITGILASIVLLLFADVVVKYCIHDLISKTVIYLICIALPFISMSSAINGYFMAIRKVYKNAIYVRSGLSTIKQLLIPYSLERSGIDCLIAISKYGIITGMVMPIINFPSVFVESFSSLLIPEFSRYYAKKDYKRAKQITKFILLLALLFCIFLNILFFAFSKNLSYLIYKNDSISSYLKTLSFVVSFLYLDIVIDSILKGLDKQFPCMIINVIDLVVSICFIYFFVPVLGVNGYIISIFLSEILNFVLSGYILYKELYNSN